MTIQRRFVNKAELFAYVKQLEVEINQYKIQEQEFEEVINNLKDKLNKNQKLEDSQLKEIEKLQNKLEFASEINDKY